jgi:hypothetical protein
MNAYYAGPGYQPPAPRSGITPTAAVLLWIFVGWPASWILLFAFAPLGILFGVGITVAMIVVVSQGGSRPLPPVVPVAPVVPAPPLPAPVSTRHQAVRNEVESLAVVTAVGGCGWCGSLVAHVNDEGHPILPRYWHAAEVEERIRAKLQY